MAEDGSNGVERRIAQERRFTRLEEQVDRLVSDAESEKETRRRANVRIVEDFAKLEKRILDLEHKVYWFSGCIAFFVFALHWLFR